MKTVLTSALLFILPYLTLQAQETTLYDHEANAICYIAFDEDATLFLWDGTPIAFLEPIREDTALINFEGELMGWYKEGNLHNTEGNIVGSSEARTRFTTGFVPIKGIKSIVPIKPILFIHAAPPLLLYNWSNTSLTHFLTEN